MNTQRLRDVIHKSNSLHPNDDFGLEACWNEMIKILSEDLSALIKFFESECTDEEFYWLGPVFEDLAEKTQSKQLISALRSRLGKVRPESYNQESFETEYMRKWIDYDEYIKEVNSDIDYAEGQIEN